MKVRFLGSLIPLRQKAGFLELFTTRRQQFVDKALFSRELSRKQFIPGHAKLSQFGRPRDKNIPFLATAPSKGKDLLSLTNFTFKALFQLPFWVL